MSNTRSTAPTVSCALQHDGQPELALDVVRRLADLAHHGVDAGTATPAKVTVAKRRHEVEAVHRCAP